MNVEFAAKESRLPTIDKLKCVGQSLVLLPVSQADFTRFRLDSTHSTFIAHAQRGGLLWFKGHEHLVAAREFFGEAQITEGKITPASLQLNVKTDSMVETSDAFTDTAKTDY